MQRQRRIRTARLFGLLLTVFISASSALPQDPAGECRELVLHNGRVTTMDARGTTASAVVIRDERIALVSTAAGVPPHSPCAKVVDLQGRRVIPGMIDTHDHVVYSAARPGYDVRLDAASSIAGLQALIRARAARLKEGEWITAIEGWSFLHLAEKRMPTLAELDAAAPANPVLLESHGAGGLGMPTPPPVTNTRGKTWLAGKGLEVSDTGIVSEHAFTAAFNALRATMTVEDRKRGMADVLNFTSSMGLTTHTDNGGPWPPMPEAAKVAAVGDGGANIVDPFTGYLPILALDREGRLPGRLRLMFYSRNLTPEVPYLRARLDNQIMGFGNDWVRMNGVGEQVAQPYFDKDGRATPQYESALRLVAERGWTLQIHINELDDQMRHAELWERVNQKTPLAPLRWTMGHVPGINRPMLDRLKALGVGVSIRGLQYLSEGDRALPPFRTIVESGTHASFGSDGPIPISPWRHIYAMVTGKNYAGKLVAAGETLNRMQALRLYTSDGAWFSFDENKLGSIETGKLADVAVLSDDFLDPARVPDEAIKNLRSVLTIVGGRIVHDAGVLGTPKGY
jgi:predicted amidohydrolase YtcJ